MVVPQLGHWGERSQISRFRVQDLEAVSPDAVRHAEAKRCRHEERMERKKCCACVGGYLCENQIRQV